MKVQVVLISALLSVLAVSSVTSECTEGVQFFPSLDDCTQYYQCDALGEPVPMQCDPGTMFDVDLLMCVWGTCDDTDVTASTSEAPITTSEAPITTTEAITTTSGAPITTTEVITTPEIGTEAPLPNEKCIEGVDYFPSTTDCAQYYQCIAIGQAVQMNCPPGLEFHPVELVCDWADNFCTIGSSSSTTTESTGTGPTEEPQSTIEPETPEINEECPEDEDPADPTHLPHPTDCSKFFKCDKGIAIEYTCPEGQHWSIDNSWCDFIANAQCPLSTTSESSGTDGTTTPAPELHPDCPEVDIADDPTHLPHPSDCTKFLKCLKGVAYENDCPVGQHWNIIQGWCDFPENANCVIIVEE